ncbi:hypothetical protein Oweho_1311 [Owenweeksia hongkongensis DSM 17368]|uniref:eCIS core domain-containing protein n=1 Tax=Owenweeksia hongkongensis (strain DSM 17368 / CIP 108786 / JCM 12287 / NRRL B-23963 / UST20020801) TaxID=926562 RepID=G8R6X5_OWEHD|nr:DUF4157 domain-containing protein [Owenweeksia hongkongensis]AEV32310.1 hypothetical protein Oweho_1311 [Owenweeksia hongkongensis DSM 17368]
MHIYAGQTSQTKSHNTQATPTPKQSNSKTNSHLTDHRPQTQRITQLQNLAESHSSKQEHPVQKKPNKTGLPDNLKAGIENLSGHSMDDVKVHYNSAKPAALQAHAYAQGTNIHLATGQEKHLPHEAWHVVQQKQRRVKPTLQMKSGVNMNDDAGLEKEADVMGEKALQFVGKRPETLAQMKLKGIINSNQERQTIRFQMDKNSSTYVQRKINPSKKLTKYLKPYNDEKENVKSIIKQLFKNLIKSGFTYQEPAIHEAIRGTTLKIKSLKSLHEKMEASFARDRDEDLGGDGAHGLGRHYAISDEALEDRLRGPRAIPTASRFQKDEGSRLNKLHNLIKNALVSNLSKPAKQIGQKVHSVMTDPTDDYASKTTNNLRKNYLQGIANVFTENYDFEDPSLGFTITSEWKIQVIGAPPIITITCEYEVESWEDFNKDQWSLSSSGDLVKGSVSEPAKMYSGSNSPIITIPTGDSIEKVNSQTKGIIENSGVTLF